MSKKYKNIRVYIQGDRDSFPVTLNNASYEILADSGFFIFSNNKTTYGYPLSKVKSFTAEEEY